MGAISIRRSRDEVTLLTLQKECLPGDEPLDARKGDWWVAEMDGEPVAFACLRPDRSDPATGYLARAGVLPKARGQGLQKRLIRVREARAKALGMKVVVTDTANFNVASSNSLIACGYKLYQPANRWGFADANYWKKVIL